MKREGGCACGAIRFETEAESMGEGACHCTDCQKFAGGGPNYVMLVPKGTVSITKGEPASYSSAGDSGATVSRVFCKDCGTHLWAVPELPPFMTIKVGAFDDAAGIPPQIHIYTDSALDWHVIPDGMPTFPKMPPEEHA